MDKIYQVFVSSTFEDLQEERKEVMQALLELDCMPAGMELFPASNDDQWTLIKRVIDACDYYLLIIGGRYGSTNDEGKSYTQMEFEYALETGKPIISFLPKHPDDIPSGKSEKDPEKQQKLESLKELAQKKLIKYWESPEQLGSIVSRSMIKLIKDFPAEGWVRSGSAVDEKSIKEIARLQKENAELQAQLNAVAIEAPKGTEQLSRGDDEVIITFTFKGYQKSTGDRYVFTRNIGFTWNDIFATIAPHMIDECTEKELEIVLTAFIKENANEYISELKQGGYHKFERFEIDIESYNTVKVQLRALGLICLSQKKRAVSDKLSYWKLTPYGDFVMTQLLAIRRT